MEILHAAMVDAFSEERLRSEGNEDGLVIQVIEELKQLNTSRKVDIPHHHLDKILQLSPVYVASYADLQLIPCGDTPRQLYPAWINFRWALFGNNCRLSGSIKI